MPKLAHQQPKCRLTSKADGGMSQAHETGNGQAFAGFAQALRAEMKLAQQRCRVGVQLTHGGRQALHETDGQIAQTHAQFAAVQSHRLTSCVPG